MSRPRRDADWLRHQAQARQQAKLALLARRGEKDEQQQQARAALSQLVTRTMALQQRLARLAPAFADRCDRVQELSGLYRAEWERAQRLAADNEELRGRIAELEGEEGPDVQSGRHAAGLLADDPRLGLTTAVRGNGQAPVSVRPVVS